MSSPPHNRLYCGHPRQLRTRPALTSGVLHQLCPGGRHAVPVYAGLLPPLADEARSTSTPGQPDATPTIIGPADSYTADRVGYSLGLGAVAVSGATRPADTDTGAVWLNRASQNALRCAAQQLVTVEGSACHAKRPDYGSVFGRGAVRSRCCEPVGVAGCR